MKKLYARAIVAGIIATVAILIGAAWVYMSSHSIDVLTPKGAIAAEQRQLMLIATALMSIVVIPVFVLTFWVVWRYREGNTKATYKPEWDRSRVAETIWWLVPLVIIIILAVITWVSSHKLDPYRALEHDKRPLTVKVIALQWKWLFIYPEQNIATVNYLYMPKDRPVNFEITADAPMNSFWIPQLGGQVYAMAGMTTKLHLIANEKGDYKGSSANLSGEGFADMRFTAHVDEDLAFYNWVSSVQRSAGALTAAEYATLAQPKRQDEPIYYATTDLSLYDSAIRKYMKPQGVSASEHTHHNHSREE